MAKRRPGTARPITAVVTVLCCSLLENACTNSCGLALVGHLFFPQGSAATVPCCGEAIFRDIRITTENLEVDLSNGTSSTGNVDGFLTTGDCTRLFDHSYAGAASNPLCRVYLGPVTTGRVSERVKLAPGTYRLFAQAWATNDAPSSFHFDLGLWSHECGLQTTQPGR
jgi:hypothetical protein